MCVARSYASLKLSPSLRLLGYGTVRIDPERCVPAEWYLCCALAVFVIRALMKNWLGLDSVASWVLLMTGDLCTNDAVCLQDLVWRPGIRSSQFVELTSLTRRYGSGPLDLRMSAAGLSCWSRTLVRYVC